MTSHYVHLLLWFSGSLNSCCHCEKLSDFLKFHFQTGYFWYIENECVISNLSKVLLLTVFLSNSLSFPGKQLHNIQTVIIFFLPILKSYLFALDIEIIKTSEHCLIDMIIKSIFVLLLILIKMTNFSLPSMMLILIWNRCYNHIFSPCF